MVSEFTNKRIFISGGAGVIGTELVNLLLQQGATIFVGDLKPCPKEWQTVLSYRQGDLITLTKEEVLAFAPEYFFHLAATFERSEESYDFFELNGHHNIALSHHLLKIFSQMTSLRRIVFASSYLVYDPNLYLFAEAPDTAVALAEDSCLAPRNLCGAAKLLHEKELQFFGQFDSCCFSTVSARIFRVYGYRSKDVISRWIEAAISGEPIQTYRLDGQFDYIFAEDVALGLMYLANSSATGAVNLGKGQAVSVQEIVSLLHSHFPQLKFVHIEKKIACEASKADINKLLQNTNWQPPCSISEGIAKLVDYKKKKGANKSFSAPEFSLLISSIGKKTPLISAVKTANKKFGNKGLVHGSDSSSACIGKYFVDQFWLSPKDSEQTIEQIINYCQSHTIGAIIPTRDGELLFFAEHKKHLKTFGIEVLISSPEAIKICLDKKYFSLFLSENGFPSIITSEAIEEVNAEKFVVKEKHGAGSHLTGLNLSKSEAIDWAKKLILPIFQPYIQGVEWSVDLYISKNKEVIGSLARKRDLVIGGESQVSSASFFPELEELCKKIAFKIGLDGHIIFQALVDSEQKIHIIECNPRFGGASTLALASGIDSFYWFLLETLGVDLSDINILPSRANLMQVRAPSDTFFAL